MSALELSFNVNKQLKRKDVIRLGQEISRVVARKKNPIDSMVIQIEGNLEDGNKLDVKFPFKIIDDEKTK